MNDKKTITIPLKLAIDLYNEMAFMTEEREEPDSEALSSLGKLIEGGTL